MRIETGKAAHEPLILKNHSYTSHIGIPGSRPLLAFLLRGLHEKTFEIGLREIIGVTTRAESFSKLGEADISQGISFLQVFER